MAISETSSHDNKIQQLAQSQHNSGSFVEMDPVSLDFDECLKDSPRFRQNLKDNLAYIDNLEVCITKVRNKINNYIETGQEHMRSQKDFIQAMRALNNSLGRSSSEISKRVETLLATLEEIMRLQEIVIDQSARTVKTSLNKFISDDVTKIKEARKSFDKIGHEFDQALTKYSQPVKKQQDDSENLLIATSTAFTHTSIDLSIQITTLQSKKGYDILGSLLSFTKAQSTFFHQGYDLFEDLKPHISDMDEFLSNIQDEFETMVRNLPSKHLMVSNNKLKPLCFNDKAQEVHLEGYLFKRASNGFKVWNRRWFILKNHQLLYQKRGDTQPTVMEEDLRLLTVRLVDKTDNDRRFCFEVLSPHKSHILQADSEASCKTWISAIQAGINAAFHDTEYRTTIVPKSNSSNEITTSAGHTATSTSSITTNNSSWGSSFSFKALQQQATSRINSISASNETKDFNHMGQRANNKNKHATNASDDDDDNNDPPCKVDDQGRSYAPLKDEDDVVDCSEKYTHESNKTTKREPPMSYPSPAANIEETSNTTTACEAPTKPQRAYMIILAMPGNDQCADCGALQPKWASINLGITLCIECAGIHRSLGVHLSKVRSLTLDTEVWSPEIVKLMLSLGNNSVNSAYLSCFRNQMKPIDADSSREQREAWIKGKYLLKSFMRPPNKDEETVDDKTDATVTELKVAEKSIEKGGESGATNTTERCLDKT